MTHEWTHAFCDDRAHVSRTHSPHTHSRSEAPLPGDGTASVPSLPQGWVPVARPPAWAVLPMCGASVVLPTSKNNKCAATSKNGGGKKKETKSDRIGSINASAVSDASRSCRSEAVLYSPFVIVSHLSKSVVEPCGLSVKKSETKQNKTNKQNKPTGKCRVLGGARVSKRPVQSRAHCLLAASTTPTLTPQCIFLLFFSETEGNTSPSPSLPPFSLHCLWRKSRDEVLRKRNVLGIILKRTVFDSCRHHTRTQENTVATGPSLGGIP